MKLLVPKISEGLGGMDPTGITFKPLYWLSPYLLHPTLPHKDIHHSLEVSHSKELVHHGLAEIAVHYQDFLLRLREHNLLGWHT